MKRLSLGYGLALALIAILALTGCPTPVPTPVPTNAEPSTLSLNDEARLGSIAVKEGDTSLRLSPLFDSNTLAYTAGVTSNATEVTMTVSPVDAHFSSVTINDVDVTATLSATIILSGGTTTATIVVTAEDATTTKTYTVDIIKAAGQTVPLTLQVVESVNGTKLGDVGYSVLNSSGDSLTTGTTDENGVATIDLAPNQYVTVVTSKNGYATCTSQMVWIDALGNSSMIAVNQKLGMTTKPAGPTMISGLYLSRQDNLLDMTSIDPTDSNFILSLNGKTYLILKFVSQNSIEATAWSGFGAKLGIDKIPTTFDGIDGALLSTQKTTEYSGFNYISYYLFDLSDMEITPGQHSMTVVAYDVANNRLQSTVPFRLAPPTFTGATIPSTAAFSNISVDIRAYPLSRGYFGKKNDVTINALSQYKGNDISYRAAVSFKLLDGTNNVAIRGFDVFRSTNGTNFTKVGTVNYGALSTGSSGTHTYYDTDSALEAGTTYYYKIRAFTDSANYKESDGTARAKLMAPFQANLTAPLNQTSFDYNPTSPNTSIPDFVFTISNTDLWSSAESDYFYFFLTIKEKSGDLKYIGRFRYNFAQSRFDCKVGNTSWFKLTSLGLDPGDINYSNGNITIKPAVLLEGLSNAATGAAIEFEEGVTYEWDIRGDLKVLNKSSNHPAYFEKAYTGGVSRSYADVYSTGANTINGAFEFYVY